ncbi:Cyclic nucleotide-binding protein [Pseudocohnilembus persalinus]|uniref:Cyclic nucleotide-binding protein n=1 Tax=Pseudocohnilembus persalinus TaxID=266149 RepID=A0A0V0QRP5_PSEPJ|nr:Cyclic nucleotide-binding protein [Pseudocohnilembus persalinus]|eukprot:KRX04704.1 Cyclic nucleotide-binding protein [Pseudocohnilembus persalinus]
MSRMKFLPVILPTSLLQMLWQLVYFLVLIFTFFYIPVYIAFKKQYTKDSLIVSYFIPITFSAALIDVLFKANSALFKKGELVVDRQEIFRIYLKRWALVDILAISPFFIRILGIGVQRYIYFLYYFKILNYLQIKNYFIQIKISISTQTKVRINFCELVALLFLFVHIIACINLSFLEFSTPDEGNWSDNFNSPLSILSLGEQYVYSLYYIFVTFTTVGYGDLSPVNQRERILCIFTVLIAAISYSFILGKVNEILLQFDEQRQKRQNLLIKANQYFKFNKIDRELQVKIKEYISYKVVEQESDMRNAEKQIMELLSDKLKFEIQIQATNSFYNRIFKNFSKQFRYNLIKITKTVTRAPNRVLQFSQKYWEDSGEEQQMLFLQSGQVCMYQKVSTLQNFSGSKYKDKHLYQLPIGSLLGEKEFFGYYQDTLKNIYYKVEGNKLAYFLSISYEDFTNLLEKFPNDKQTFCELRDCYQQRLFKSKYSGTILYHQCKPCESVEHVNKASNHATLNCPYITYDKKKALTCKKYIYNIYKSSQERSQFQRKTRKITIQTKNYKILHKPKGSPWLIARDLYRIVQKNFSKREVRQKPVEILYSLFAQQYLQTFQEQLHFQESEDNENIANSQQMNLNCDSEKMETQSTLEKLQQLQNLIKNNDQLPQNAEKAERNANRQMSLFSEYSDKPQNLTSYNQLTGQQGYNQCGFQNGSFTSCKKNNKNLESIQEIVKDQKRHLNIYQKEISNLDIDLGCNFKNYFHGSNVDTILKYYNYDREQRMKEIVDQLNEEESEYYDALQGVYIEKNKNKKSSKLKFDDDYQDYKVQDHQENNHINSVKKSRKKHALQESQGDQQEYFDDQKEF